MRVREEMFDEFFKHRLPDDGFTLAEVYEEYFGLIEKTQNGRSELHGYAVTMDGQIIIPELRPSVESARA